MTKYLMILSHGVVQFREFGFHFLLQPELLIDKVDLGCVKAWVQNLMEIGIKNLVYMVVLSLTMTQSP